jgi:hypothetical protein
LNRVFAEVVAGGEVRAIAPVGGVEMAVGRGVVKGSRGGFARGFLLVPGFCHGEGRGKGVRRGYGLSRWCCGEDGSKGRK